MRCNFVYKDNISYLYLVQLTQDQDTLDNTQNEGGAEKKIFIFVDF